jgi:hypothetical protein
MAFGSHPPEGNRSTALGCKPQGIPQGHFSDLFSYSVLFVQKFSQSSNFKQMLNKRLKTKVEFVEWNRQYELANRIVVEQTYQ